MGLTKYPKWSIIIITQMEYFIYNHSGKRKSRRSGGGDYSFYCEIGFFISENIQVDPRTSTATAASSFIFCDPSVKKQRIAEITKSSAKFRIEIPP